MTKPTTTWKLLVTDETRTNHLSLPTTTYDSKAAAVAKALTYPPMHSATVHKVVDGVAVHWYGINMQTGGIGGRGVIAQ